MNGIATSKRSMRRTQYAELICTLPSGAIAHGAAAPNGGGALWGCGV
jgi:hypothetical protein